MDLSSIGSFTQILSFFLNGFNTHLNNQLRAETLKNQQLKDENQLKLFHQQQQYKRYDMWMDFNYKLLQKANDHVIELHRKKCEQCNNFYPIFEWHKCVENKPAPIILISTNIERQSASEKIISNPPLDELIYSLLKFNEIQSNFLTITSTKEYFSSISDVEQFYNRELHSCPAIIVYGNLSDSSFDIMICKAGISNNQEKIYSEQDGNKQIFIPQTFRLWKIEYTKLHNWKANTLKNTNNPYQWLKELAFYIESIAGIWIQSFIDEYFQNDFNYKLQALKYLNERKEKFKHLPEWESFENEIAQRHQIIAERQNEILVFQRRQLEKQNTIKLKFLPITNRIEILNKNELIIKDDDENELKPFLVNWGKNSRPSFFCGSLKVKGNNGKYGFINTDGRLIIPFEYEEAGIMRKNLVAVKHGNKWGMLTNEGKVHLGFNYEQLHSPSPEGIILFGKNGYLGMADMSGTEIISKRFKTYTELLSYERIGISFSEDTIDFMRWQRDKDIIKKKKKESSDFIFGKNYDTKLKLFEISENSLFGFIDENNKRIYECIFYEIIPFEFERAFVRLSQFPNDVWAIIDTNGNILVESYL